MLAMARTVAIKPAVLFLNEATEDVQHFMIDLIRDVVIRIKAQNLPGVSMTIVDGAVTNGRSRNTQPANRLPEVIASKT